MEIKRWDHPIERKRLTMSFKDFTNSGASGSKSLFGSSGASGSISSGIPMPSTQSDDGDFDPQEFLINYNEKYANASQTLFRNNIIKQMIGILIGKDKPNPILVGAAGTGKTKIVEELARLLATDDPILPDVIKEYTIWELPLSNIVAGSGIVGQLESKIKSIISFAQDEDNKAILFIDEVHQLSGNDPIYSKIAQILKPAMARGDVKIIGATTLQEYQSLAKDPAFNRRFTRLIVDELTREQTIEVMKAAKASYLKHYSNKLLIDDDTLELVATIADQYSAAGNHRPDTALTLLDRACGEAIVDRKCQEQKAANDPMILNALKANPLITLSETKVKNTAMKIATGQSKQATFDEDSLRNHLSQIKGQDDIIETLVKRLTKISRNLFPRKQPLAFLFAGSSGVGKTQVTKIIADELTGMPPIALNMTEYHSSAAIARIIGSPAGYVGYESKAELPFDCLESNPYQVILLDEFEKADKSVQRLFMGALDEGYIKTSRGKVVDFSKSIIIATTNASHSAGATESIGFIQQPRKVAENKAEIDNLKNWFDTELLNRFTKILTFNKLSKDIYKTILADIYTREIKRIKSEHHGIHAADELDDDTINEIADKTYVASFGARPAEKAIRDYIEDCV